VRKSSIVTCLTLVLAGCPGEAPAPSPTPASSPTEAVSTVAPSGRTAAAAPGAGPIATGIEHEIFPGPAVNARGAAFPTAQVGVVVGYDGVARTGDGGRSWETVDIGDKVPMLGAFFFDAQSGFVVGGCSGGPCPTPGVTILKTSDGGGSWTRTVTGAGGEQALDVLFLTRDKGFVAAGGRLLRTDDGGVSWRTVHERPSVPTGPPLGNTGWLHHLRFADADVGYALAGRQLLRSVDGGESFELLPFGEDTWIESIGVTAGDTVLGLGQRTALRRVRGGELEALASKTPMWVRAVRFLDEKVAFAAGSFGPYRLERGAVLVTRDAGATWALVVEAAELSTPMAIVQSAPDTVMVVSTRGVARVRVTGPGEPGVPLADLRLPDLSPPEAEPEPTGRGTDGAGCAAIRTPRRPLPACSSVRGAGVTFSCDGGVSLARAQTPKRGVFWKVLPLAGGSTVLAWSRTELFRSVDGGCTFSPHAELELSGLEVVPATRDVAYAFVPSKASVFRIDAVGMKAVGRVPTDGLGALAVDRDHERRLRAADHGGRIWDSNDAGASWSALGTNEVPLAGVAAFDRANLDHAILPGTSRGALVTFDGGRSWIEPSGPPELHDLVYEAAISPVDGRVVWVVGAVGVKTRRRSGPVEPRLFRSTDGGRSFEPAFPAEYVRAALHPDPLDAEVVLVDDGTALRRFDASTGEVTRTMLPATVTALAVMPDEPRLLYFGLHGRFVLE
jgi:photosystem II stability/assembly factor-like uncharacterized protein